jgi:anti-sigma B factor antagonist
MAAIDGEGAAEITIETRSDNSGAPVVVLSGELDSSNVDALSATLASIIAGQPKRMIFDLSALRFMDSAGIAVLVGVARSVDSVCLHEPSDVVRRIIEVTGLSELLPSEP